MTKNLVTKRNKHLKWMVLATLFISSGSVFAEEDSVELAPLEVTGKVNSNIHLEESSEVGKMDVPIEDTPFSISIIDGNFIKDTGAKNIQDALLYTSGVNAANFGFDTRGDSAYIRGLSPSLFLDGLKQSFGFYNSVRTNVYALENIEVLKGPSSTLYGQGELGGIINSVSKFPKEEFGGEVWAQYGTFNRKQLAFDITGPITKDNTLLYRVVGLTRDSDTQVDHVEDDGYLFSPSLTWNINDRSSLSFLLNRQENKGQVSAQFFPQVGTLTRGPKGYIDTDTFVGEPDWDRYDREKTEATLKFDHQFNNDWSISGITRYTDSSTEIREHWTQVGIPLDADGNTTRSIHTSDNGTEIFNIDLRLQGKFQLGVTQHSVLVGLDYQDAFWEQDNVLNGTGFGGPINVYNPQYGFVNTAALAFAADGNDNEIKQVGFYVADHIEIGSVVLSLGLRRDWAENTLLAVTGSDTTSNENETTGRIGLMYKFDNGLSPYISYAEAFNMNLGTDGFGSTLKPTTGDQTEIGLKYISPDKSLGITAAYFEIEQENRSSNGVTPGGVKQIGADIDGWELQINKRWKRFETQFSYTDMSADNETVRLPYVAETIASWWNQFFVTDNLRIGAGIRYTGNNLGADFFGTGVAGPEIPSETLYDASIGYTYNQWEFTLDAKNLSDEKYVSWCRGEGFDCGYGERRTVTANVRYKF